MLKSFRSRAHCESARLFFLNKYFKKAIDEYTKALQFEDKPSTHLLRSVSYVALLEEPAEYFDEKTPIARAALPDFNFCIKYLKKSGNFPNFPFELKDYYYFRALSYVYLLNPKMAIDDINLAISMSPENPKFLTFRGGIYLDSLNDPKKASYDFTSAINLDPSADKLLFLAWCYIDLNDSIMASKTIHLAATMDIDVLNMEREHNPLKEHQWKTMRSNYLRFVANR